MYIYQSSVYCDSCGDKMLSHLVAEGVENTGDSDDFPQRCLPSEADLPQYCVHCWSFLRNPLTDDGRDYVHRLVFNYYHGLLPWIAEDSVEEVRKFYGVPLPY